MKPLVLLSCVLITGASWASQETQPQDTGQIARKLSGDKDPELIRKFIREGDASVAKLLEVSKRWEGARVTIAYILGAISTPKSARALEPFLLDTKPEVRDEAILGLLYARRPTNTGIHGEPYGYEDGNFVPIARLGMAAVPALTRGLRHKEYLARWAAAHTFGMIYDSRIVTPILANLSNLGGWALYEAGMAIAPYHDVRIPPALIARIDEGSPNEFSHTLTGYALKEMGPWVLRYMADDLKTDTNVYRMLNIIWHVSKEYPLRAYKMVADAAVSKRAVSRLFAAYALPSFETGESRTLLKKLTKDSDVKVREKAKSSLAEMKG